MSENKYVVAVDSCWFRRPSEETPFRALLGIAVTIKDRDSFRKAYDNQLDWLFIKYKKERKKLVYKAAFLTEQLLHTNIDFMKDLIQGISDELIRIDIYYTFYPKDSISKIMTCRDTYQRAYTPEKFMDMIYNAYPHYCVWKYIDSHPDCKHYKFEVDFFHGKISPAWEDIQGLPNLKLYFKGGHCNKSISIADIILRLICETLPGRLGLLNLTRCLKDIIGKVRLSSYFMGHYTEYLKKLAFTSLMDIDTRAYVTRPIYWIVWKGYTGSGDEKKLLEWSREFTDIMRLAEESDGCARLYEPSILPHQIDEKLDKAYLVNEEARPLLRAIQSIAPKIEVVYLRK